MAADKPHQTSADYVTMALSPAFIMGLVGSLVFFLLEILYVGQYEGRLEWILFCFVFACVLIARMSMQSDLGERAPIYGLVLAVVVYLALRAFVQYPPDSPMSDYATLINLGLMALIWWCAHKLTWDCTYIDDAVDASGMGVLEAAGLDDPEGKPQISDTKSEKDDSPAPPASGLSGWRERYQRYREERRRRPHTPGVWVVYFSLAALPLFGLGQSLIPAEDLARRRYAFWLMGIYVGSGLGLLLTTCFLGLRRYLRQRKLQMPAAMTGVWLVTGGIMAAALLVAGALLPRPNAEYPLVKLSPVAGSKDREASRYAAKGDSPGKGQGRTAAGESKDKDKGSPGSGSQSDDGGSGGNKEGSGGKGSKGNSGSEKNQNQQGGGDSKDQSGKDSSRDDSRSDDKQEQGKDDKSEASNQGERATAKGEKSESSSGGKRSSQENKSNSSGGKPSSPPKPSSPSSLSSLFKTLAVILKWVVFAILAVAVVCVVLYLGVKFLANFTGWARRLLDSLRAWWQGLFGGKPEGVEDAEGEGVAALKAKRPFSSFRNPFRGGGADRQSPEELVCYSFEALEAWTRERGVVHEPEQTPLEFVERIGEDLPGLEAEARRLTALYLRVAYGPRRLPASAVNQVRQFWQRLEEMVEAPLST